MTLVNGEESKFTKVDQIDLYNDGIGYVQLWDASHSNESEAQRIHTVTQLGSIAYGNEEAKNPKALYKRLQELKHESLWEFIRDGYHSCTIKDSMRKYMNAYDLGVINKLLQQSIACFRIKAPIFVARQFMRHRSFSYIEMSRRYTKDSKVPFEFYSPDISDNENSYNIMCTISSIYGEAIDYYNELIRQGLHTQVASRFLPQTTYTEFYMMGEVEGLKNFFQLRLDSHAQAEIRELAQGMIDLLEKHQPELYQKVKND